MLWWDEVEAKFLKGTNCSEVDVSNWISFFFCKIRKFLAKICLCLEKNMFTLAHVQIFLYHACHLTNKYQLQIYTNNFDKNIFLNREIQRKIKLIPQTNDPIAFSRDVLMRCRRARKSKCISQRYVSAFLFARFYRFLLPVFIFFLLFSALSHAIFCSDEWLRGHRPIRQSVCGTCVQTHDSLLSAYLTQVNRMCKKNCCVKIQPNGILWQFMNVVFSYERARSSKMKGRK